MPTSHVVTRELGEILACPSLFLADLQTRLVQFLHLGGSLTQGWHVLHLRERDCAQGAADGRQACAECLTPGRDREYSEISGAIKAAVDGMEGGGRQRMKGLEILEKTPVACDRYLYSTHNHEMKQQLPTWSVGQTVCNSIAVPVVFTIAAACRVVRARKKTKVTRTRAPMAVHSSSVCFVMPRAWHYVRT